MSNPLLIIGNKNYSSWSLRAWLLLKAFDVNFDERLIPLFDPAALPTLKQYSPTAKVPVLVIHPNSEQISSKQLDSEQKITVSDSLAIALHANDYLTDLDIWTGKAEAHLKSNKSSNKTDMALQAQRAFCQSIVTEMHSGFMGVRNEIAMNIRATAKVTPSSRCLKDIQRLEDIFATCLNSDAHKNSANNYLFGDFTVADAWYAPVVFRLRTYAANSGIELREITKQYCETMLAHPHIKQWREDALQETTVLPEDETGEIISVEGVLAG